MDPSIAGVAGQLDDFVNVLREMRAEHTTKIADSNVDLTLKMQAFRQQVTLVTARLSVIEMVQLAVRATIDSLMSSLLIFSDNY